MTLGYRVSFFFTLIMNYFILITRVIYNICYIKEKFMSARRKIQKEDIIQESVSIVAKEGINALNSRKNAKNLGCSTQPLF